VLGGVEHHDPATQVGFGGPNTENSGAGRVDSGDRNHDRHDLTRQPRLPGDCDYDWCVRLERVTRVVIADAGAGGGVDETGGGFEQIQSEAEVCLTLRDRIGWDSDRMLGLPAGFWW